MSLSPETRARHREWLLDVTSIPTASGRERRVIAWIERWAAERPGVVLSRDPAGNLVLTRRRDRPGEGRPVYFTAHLDHPGFVVERVVAPRVVEASFRGGVMADYFNAARVEVIDAGDARVAGTVAQKSSAGAGPGGPFDHYLIDLDAESGAAPGDVAAWALPRAHERDGLIHAPACDDLAAVAAALSAYDVLLATTEADGPAEVRLLFTRAEEIGFVGAIGAVRHGTLPKDARVIALENSRAFAESPVGGGPIVRVGDRLSVFSPTLTDAIARRAEEVAGGPMPTASQKLAQAPAWKWQRRLMPGGACEATVFCHAGLEATCLCLPLGNYHNMANLAGVQAGEDGARAQIASEFIALEDYHGLVDLLVACGRRLGAGAGVGPRLDRFWRDLAFVLNP